MRQGKTFPEKLSLILLIFALILPLSVPSRPLNAAAVAAKGDKVEVLGSLGFVIRKEASTASAKVGSIRKGGIFTVHEVVSGQYVNPYGNKWYRVNYNQNAGYVIADQTGQTQKIIKKTAPTPTPTPKPSPTPGPTPTPAPSPTPAPLDIVPAYSAEEWKKLLSSFPPSYHESLSKLHADHPNWRFEPYFHDYSLNYAADVELAVPARNLVPYYFTEYRNMDDTKIYDAGGWYACNREALLFMLDPRNWLNEKYIFMFEKMTEVADVQNVTAERRLASMYKNNADLTALIPTIIEASKAHGVSSVFIGARILTEVQTTRNGVKTISASAKGTLRIPKSELELLGVEADPDIPYYNLFNIGAYQGTNPQKNAVLYAMGHGISDARKERLMLPWDSQYKAIYGGINFVKGDYLDRGQNTNYYMKFNLQPKKEDLTKRIYHQYMGSVFAPATEGSVQYGANLRADAMHGDYIFLIPVFEDMPDYTYPNPGSYYPDSVPPQQPAEGDGLDHSLTEPIRFADKGDKVILKSRFVLRKEAGSLSEKLQIVDRGSKLEVLDRVSGQRVTGMSDQWYRVAVGSSKGYIIAYPPEQDVEVNKQYLLGDTDGDGLITINDSIVIRYHLLGKRQMTKEELLRADADKDGQITINDSIRIRYHLLGKKKLETEYVKQK